MTARGGKRPGAGRPKGRRNKRTEAQAKAVEASGVTPLDFLLNTMRNAKADLAFRIDAAKAAAPYVHPRLAQTELTLHGNLRTMTDEQLDARILELAAEEGLGGLIGRASPPEGAKD